MQDNSILKAIIDGIHEANKLYIELSGDASIRDYGIEPYVSSKIAHRLFKEANRSKAGQVYVTLETPFSKIVEFSNPDVKMKGADARRADVVCWNSDTKPIGIIELKRHFVFSNSVDDIDRIIGLMEKLGPHKNGSLQFGAVAGFRERWDSNKKQHESIRTDFENTCKKHFKSYKFFSDSSEKNVAGQFEPYQGESLQAFQAFAVVFRREN